LRERGRRIQSDGTSSSVEKNGGRGVSGEGRINIGTGVGYLFFGVLNCLSIMFESKAYM